VNPKQKYFEILGLSPTTDKSVIKKAYRKLAFQYHPDKNDSENAQAKFIEITDAYEIVIGEKQVPQSKANRTNQQPQTNQYSKSEKKERIKAAKARYEKAKQKELESEAQYFFELIKGKKWKFLKIFGLVSALFSVVLILDYALPTHNKFYVIEEVFKDDYSSQISIEIDNSTHYFDFYKARMLEQYPLIEVNFTPIFNDFKSFTFVGGPNIGQYVEPIFCYIYFFPIIIILLLIPLFTVWYKKPTPIFSILHKMSFYAIPILFVIILFSNWRVFQIFI